jgi:hypothetical protein
MATKKATGTEPVTAIQFQALADTIDRWRATVQAKLDQHHKTLYGNGEPGMDENIREILKYIKQEQEVKQRRRESWNKIQFPVITAGILGAIAFIYDVWAHIAP